MQVLSYIIYRISAYFLYRTHVIVVPPRKKITQNVRFSCTIHLLAVSLRAFLARKKHNMFNINPSRKAQHPMGRKTNNSHYDRESITPELRLGCL